LISTATQSAPEKKAIRRRLYRLRWWLAALLLSLFWFWLCLPARLFHAPISWVIEDATGNLLSASIAADGQWRFPATGKVPLKFAACITTFEDKRFFYHPGVDPVAIVRALRSNIGRGAVVQGGSTINMQVIRLSYGSRKRNFWNKIREALLAVRLQCSYSKKQVLALYAANAPFGTNVVGLEAAAWRYFGRSPAKLSWGEMAALAVLPNAPSLVHPGKNRDVLMEKRNRLLERLLSAGKIDSATCALAKLEALPGAPLSLPQWAPHLLQRFRKENRLPGGSTRITSTIDGDLQTKVAGIVQQHQSVLKGNGINNACALVLDVESGAALAYIGNIADASDKEMEADVDVVSARRSPGSALKPILYAAMLTDGLMLPNSLVADIPMYAGGYSPKNFDMGYDGAVPAGKALSRSLNIPAVRELQDYKYQRFYETLQQSGITTLDKPAGFYGLSLILGGCEVTMWDLAGVYASMARMLNHQAGLQGKSNPEDFHPPSYTKTPFRKQVARDEPSLDATSIWFSFLAMKDVMRPGEEGLWQQFSSAQTIAWKTGTSFGFRDGWAIGVTPKHVVAVWVGNTDGEGRPGLTGVKTAAPILFNIFRLLPTVAFFPKPAFNYSWVPVCRQTGFRANIDCADVDTLYMPPSGERSPVCPYHKMINLDASGRFRVTEACEDPLAMQHKSWLVLSPAMEYYYKQRNLDYQSLPPFKAGCGSPEGAKAMELIYPPEGAKIYIPLEINGEKGNTIFSAAHRRAGAKIFWSLDDGFAGTTQNFHELALDPSPGKHIITLVDESGSSISRKFEVLEKEKNKQ
jgi:penicillin-binding protein 1C